MTVGLGLSVVGVRMGSGRRGRRVGDGSCRSPPTPAVAVEEIDVVDDLALQQPVELLRVDAVGSLDLAVQPRGAGLDADVSDALVEQVPVECGAEFLAVVGLDLLDLERQLGEDVVDELDGGLLVVARVGAEDPEPGAVIDRGVLVVALLPACLAQWLDELHIDLELVAGALLLIALPARLGAFVPLRRG